MTLMEVPEFESITFYTRCTNCDALILSERCECFFFRFPTRDASPPEACHFFQALCTNDMATSKIMQSQNCCALRVLQQEQCIVLYHAFVHILQLMLWKDKSILVAYHITAGAQSSVLKYASCTQQGKTPMLNIALWKHSMMINLLWSSVLTVITFKKKRHTG